MTRFFRSAILLTMFCWPLCTLAQEVPPLAKKLEKVFEEKEPKWKIERPYVQMSPPVMHLKSPQGDVLIYFWLMDSERTAQEVFDGHVIGFGNILGKRKKETRLTNFGDDNRLLSDTSGRFADLSFRKGKICIGVSAPSVAIAKKFAQYVMEQVLAQDDTN
jgi:hypothetical protein